MKKLAEQIEEIKDEYRDVPREQLYRERLEAAGMQTLTQAVLDKDFETADKCIEIMERLSIV